MFKSQKNLIVRHKIHYFFSAALVIILICGTIKYLQVSAAIAQFADFAPPPESITSVKAKLAEWPKVKKAVGELVSIEGAKLSVQSSGRVLDITFEAGSFVNKGDVLVKLDTEKEQAALRAAVAENDRSRISYERLKNLLQKNAVSKDEVEIAQARYAETQALVARAEQDLRDKTVYAPISGYAGIRRVNIGQFVSPGENIVEINRLDRLYFNFMISQQDISTIKKGSRIELIFDSYPKDKFEAVLTAVNSQVDSQTRNIWVQATLDNRDLKLRPGMFGQAFIYDDVIDSFLTIPVTAINYAPYGNSVFVIAEKKDKNSKSYFGAESRFIKLGERRGNQVAVIEGLKELEEVATSGLFKLRSGMAVVIDNSKAPIDSFDPQPIDM